jgi:hypothetical protein
LVPFMSTVMKFFEDGVSYWRCCFDKKICL